MLQRNVLFDCFYLVVGIDVLNLGGGGMLLILVMLHPAANEIIMQV